MDSHKTIGKKLIAPFVLVLVETGPMQEERSARLPFNT